MVEPQTQTIALDKEMSTSDKILYVAIELIATKDYKSVTIKEIASNAGISEMTVFRHFGSKIKILEEAIDQYYYTIPMKKIFEEKVVWDLRQDLFLIGKTYHELMKRNKKVIQIAFKDGHTIPGLFDQINKHPRQLKDLIVSYFQKMQEMGKMIPTNAESQAMIFLYLNYGEFLSRSFVEGHKITSLSQEEILNTTVDLFVRGIST